MHGRVGWVQAATQGWRCVSGCEHLEVLDISHCTSLWAGVCLVVESGVLFR